jgi:hypothetical protein
VRVQDNGYDGPYEEVDQDQDGDYSCCGVGKESELGREARDEALDPLRPSEGEEGHREEEGSWGAGEPRSAPNVRMLEDGGEGTLKGVSSGCPAVGVLSFCRQPH